MIPATLKHQTQPTPMSCVCTCLAMLLDVPAQTVICKYHDSYFVEQTIEMDEILQQEGFEFTQHMSGQCLSLLPGALYLLTVASLNIVGGFHQVVVDYRDSENPQVLDPAKGYSNRKYYTLDLNEVDENDNAFHLFSWMVDFTITGRK